MCRSPRTSASPPLQNETPPHAPSDILLCHTGSAARCRHMRSTVSAVAASSLGCCCCSFPLFSWSTCCLEPPTIFQMLAVLYCRRLAAFFTGNCQRSLCTTTAELHLLTPNTIDNAVMFSLPSQVLHRIAGFSFYFRCFLCVSCLTFFFLAEAASFFVRALPILEYFAKRFARLGRR